MKVLTFVATLIVLLTTTTGCLNAVVKATDSMVPPPTTTTKSGTPVITDRAATTLLKEVGTDLKSDRLEKDPQAIGERLSAITIASAADRNPTTILKSKKPNKTMGGYDVELHVKGPSLSPTFKVHVPESRAKDFFNGAKVGQKVAVDLLSPDEGAKVAADYLRLVPLK